MTKDLQQNQFFVEEGVWEHEKKEQKWYLEYTS